MFCLRTKHKVKVVLFSFQYKTISFFSPSSSRLHLFCFSKQLRLLSLYLFRVLRNEYIKTIKYVIWNTSNCRVVRHLSSSFYKNNDCCFMATTANYGDQHLRARYFYSRQTLKLNGTFSFGFQNEAVFYAYFQLRLKFFFRVLKQRRMQKGKKLAI